VIPPVPWLYLSPALLTIKKALDGLGASAGPRVEAAE